MKNVLTIERTMARTFLQAEPFGRNGGHGWGRTNGPPRVRRMLSR
jgi:hypothetical protein